MYRPQHGVFRSSFYPVPQAGWGISFQRKEGKERDSCKLTSVPVLFIRDRILSFVGTVDPVLEMRKLMKK